MENLLQKSIFSCDTACTIGTPAVVPTADGDHLAGGGIIIIILCTCFESEERPLCIEAKINADKACTRCVVINV